MVDWKVVWPRIGLLRYVTTCPRVHCEDRRNDSMEFRFPTRTHSPYYFDTAHPHTFHQPAALNYAM